MHTVIFSVFDGGVTIDGILTIEVAPANDAPSISSTPPNTGEVGSLYSYDVQATDLDGDTLAFSLTGGPAGMTIGLAAML